MITVKWEIDHDILYKKIRYFHGNNIVILGQCGKLQPTLFPKPKGSLLVAPKPIQPSGPTEFSIASGWIIDRICEGIRFI